MSWKAFAGIRAGICVLCLAWAIPMNLEAATVEWGISGVVYGQAGYDGADWLYTIGRPYLNVKADVLTGGLALTALPDSNLANANTFAVAAKGDVVSREYMAAKGSYFAWAEYGNPSVRTDYSIILKDGESVYLAFAADYNAYGMVRYGWLELGLDEGGGLTVRSSAWDVDGDAVAVGAIPEPSGALLLLLGLGGLGLRRRAPQFAPIHLTTSSRAARRRCLLAAPDIRRNGNLVYNTRPHEPEQSNPRD